MVFKSIQKLFLVFCLLIMRSGYGMLRLHTNVKINPSYLHNKLNAKGNLRCNKKIMVISTPFIQRAHQLPPTINTLAHHCPLLPSMYLIGATQTLKK